MAMSVGSGGDSDEPMMEINTTPLIDVMLVLLIMLIITIPVQTHAVKLDFPQNAPPPPTPPPIVNIVVDFDGSIYWDDDANALDRPTLQAKLAAIGAVAKADQPQVNIRPNKLATYKYVAEVMASAQHLGVGNIALGGNDQFINE